MTEADTQRQTAPRKVRGVATFHDDDSVEFAPYNSGGEPVQKNVRKRGDSRFYETDGEKQSSYVCHLKVGKDSEDPAAEMFDQLKYLTKSMQKKEPPVPRTKTLLDQKGLRVWHRRQEHKVIVQMELSTEGTAELSSKLFNLTAEVNKCFAINRTSLRPQK